jgi:hypothetical protein
VNIGKQRRRPTSAVELQFKAELTCLGHLAREEAMPEIR